MDWTVGRTQRYVRLHGAGMNSSSELVNVNVSSLSSLANDIKIAINEIIPSTVIRVIDTETAFVGGTYSLENLEKRWHTV